MLKCRVIKVKQSNQRSIIVVFSVFLSPPFLNPIFSLSCTFSTCVPAETSITLLFTVVHQKTPKFNILSAFLMWFAGRHLVETGTDATQNRQSRSSINVKLSPYVEKMAHFLTIIIGNNKTEISTRWGLGKFNCNQIIDTFWCFAKKPQKN